MDNNVEILPYEINLLNKINSLKNINDECINYIKTLEEQNILRQKVIDEQDKVIKNMNILLNNRFNFK